MIERETSMFNILNFDNNIAGWVDVRFWYKLPYRPSSASILFEEKTMTLGYTATQPLAIPAEAFNKIGRATIVVSGQTDREGAWVLYAHAVKTVLDGPRPVGCIQTDKAPNRPERAVKAAKAWMKAECARSNLELVSSENRNRRYQPAEALFSASIVFVVDRNA
jgi:hypothetical protein